MSLQYLRTHTHFSIKGGPAAPAEWCRHASDMGYKALGLADRAPLAALPEFAREAAAADITPIFGLELDLELSAGAQPVVLYACDGAGLANLYALAGLSYSRWPQAARPVRMADITAHAQGLLLVAPGEGSPSLEWAAELRPHFPGRLFVGLRPDDGAHARVAAEVGLPLVALPAARYLRAEDARACAALYEARVRSGWEQPGGYNPAAEGDFLRPPSEAEALFDPWPEAVANAQRIVEMCTPAASALSYTRTAPPPSLDELKARVQAALPALLGVQDLPEDAQARLSAEWARIERPGTAEAWLTLAKVIDKARAERIPLGVPLGSADGSLVALGLGINSLNPLGYAEPSWFGSDANTLPGVEVPASRRSDLLSVFAEGTAAHAACYLPVTPLFALQAACSVLNVACSSLADLAENVREEGWRALEGAAPTSEIARLALALKGSPIVCKPDRDSVALLSPERALPLIGNGEGLPHWTPWTLDALSGWGCPALLLRANPVLTTLDITLNHAGRRSKVDLSGFPALSEEAAALLRKGELAGISYISPKALKGWKGDFTPENAAALVADSSGHAPAKGPDLPAWANNTADTGGALLYYDQFSAVARAAASTAPHEAAALRLAMLNPSTADAQGALRARFVAGCLQKGLDAESAARLYSALSEAAPRLISRDRAHAYGRIALWSAQLKAAHPAAFAAAALEVAWARGGRVFAQPVLNEARHHGLTFLAPDVRRSAAGPTLVGIESGDDPSILWGLTQLPAWDAATAARFAAARAEANLDSLPGLIALITRAGLNAAQVEALLRSGACDSLGARQALLLALPALPETLPEAPPPAAIPVVMAVVGPDALPETLPEAPPPSPRQRYLMRLWEEQSLGVGFTTAPEMEQLAHMLGQNPALRDKLLTTMGIDASQVDQSICMVGLLHDVDLLPPPPDPKGRGGEDTPLAVAWVEDLEGEIELVAFPPNYKRHKDLWAEGSLAIITARVCAHKDGEGVYLLCEHLARYQGQVEEEIMTLKVRAPRKSDTSADPGPGSEPSSTHSPATGREVPAGSTGAQKTAPYAVATSADPAAPVEPPAYHLVITLPVSHDDHADIDRMLALDKLLRARPGPDTVTLRIPYSPETGAVTSAQLPRGVRYAPGLEAGIRDLLGPDALALIKLLG